MAEKRNDDFRKKYPHLTEELGGAGTSRISRVRSSAEEAEKATRLPQGYDPTAIGFIRRCETEEQALEIIKFLEAKGEIKPGYAKQLRAQLVEKGLGSFGKKKDPGCYYRGEG
jgi:hypothetical protein